MVGFVNKVIFIGYFGNDFEICCMQDGKFIVFLWFVIFDIWCDKVFGECCECIEWYIIVVFNEGFVKIVE